MNGEPYNSSSVPLEEELLQIARDEKECKSVATVLVFFTGGAFGMVEGNGIMEPQSHALTHYLYQMPIFNDVNFAKEFRKGSNRSNAPIPMPTCSSATASVSLAMPLTKEKVRILYRTIEYDIPLDSSNCRMETWIDLARNIECWYESFDGFVILHDTDTLPFAASALSFLFENLSKPVVLTGSEIPLSDLRSDGHHNLLNSIIFAGAYNIPEVTVFVQNTLYRGNRVVKMTTTDFAAFVSPNCPPLAETTGSVKVHSERIWKSSERKAKLRVHSTLCPNVAILRLFPSISIETVRAFFQPPIRGIILQTYGAGNVPSENKELMEFLKEASEKHQFLILNITQCWRGAVAAVYATGAVLDSIGVVSGCDMTAEAALMKLAYVLGKWTDITTQRRMLAQSLRGEMTQTEVETKDVKQSVVSAPILTEPVPLEHIQKLGNLLESAAVSGMARIWSQKLFTALMCSAAELDDCETLEQLYRISGHFEWPDYTDCYPLHVAAGAGSNAACRFMLETGANPNVVDGVGYTPLSYAIRSRNATPALVKTICHFHEYLPSLASIRARETNNAARLGRVKQLQMYRFAGLKLQEHDAEGRAPLHVAVAYNQLETVRYLIRPEQSSSTCSLYENSEANISEYAGAGVNPNQLTGYGKTALMEAQERNYTEIIKLLEATN